ncbi:hypothetical protein BJ973_004992 [Actinoplanes tereljensis]|uniref:Uncharacterized protein n=1 Tax=Paractinoplanes tereljensis TaxID=571912 RepID=A0A919NN53_9ACTN|nr:hypothetical protein [Actinoplanes tereljensis]GIF21563.1 hypothetical protein Ate02nite_42930 [Actinoplanes tereljensis]
MPAENPVTPILGGDSCTAKLPTWGVTREFRFGQFIRLYNETVTSTGRTVSIPIVLNTSGDIVETPARITSTQRVALKAGLNGNTATGPAPLSTAGAGAAPSIGLNVIASGVDPGRAVTGQADLSLAIADVDHVIGTGSIKIDNATFNVDLSAQAAGRLRQGESVLTVATADGKSAVVRLNPAMQAVNLEAGSLDQVLASRQIETELGTVTLDENGIRDLLATGTVTATATKDGVATGLAQVNTIGAGDSRPATAAMGIADLAEFLAYPVIPTTSGGGLVLQLGPEEIRALRRGEQITTRAGDDEVKLIWPREDELLPEGFRMLGRARPINQLEVTHDLRRMTRDADRYSMRKDGDKTGTFRPPPIKHTSSTGNGLIDLSTVGLPVAVLLPWKQTWTLTGFTRGNLISSLAMAPGEETTITVSSWERRSKSLIQSAETDIDQSFDYTSSTRDTEDVMREVTSTNEFDAQAYGSLDASYSPGVASIRVQVGGEVSNAQSLANATKSSTQHVRESTSHAATRVRSRRVTTITESIETEQRTSVVRTIRNPNQGHTLTMNFHEVLAHYDINLVFNKAGVRIVVLVPNPVEISTFTELDVRVNEATLRNGLLDAALVEGFEACRTLEAYKQAAEELHNLAVAGKKEKDLDRHREKPGTNQPAKPDNPYTATVNAILTDLKRRAGEFTSVDVQAALTSIAAHRSPTSAELSAAQRWLWKRLVGAKFGTGLTTELDRLAGASVTPEAARSLLSAVPPAGSAPALDGLGGVGDKDKEDAGLALRITSMPGYVFWDWGTFWYPNGKKEGIYDVEDGGIPGALAQLKTAFQNWEAKEAEGAGQQAAAAVVAAAGEEQTTTTIADKLEMKFGAEMIGSARERSQTLLTHLNQHRDYYRYVLFQALPPSEQLQRLMEGAPQLKIGMFEPHVVASDGPNLAIPLAPLAETTLMKVVTSLATEMEKATQEAEASGERIATDTVILPTPGISVESWRGDCEALEDHLVELRVAEARRAVAEARVAELEADRRAARIAAGDLDDPLTPPNSFAVKVEND